MALDSKKLSEARKYFNDVISIQADHPDANYNLGLISLRYKDFGSALRFFETAIRLIPQSRNIGSTICGR